MGFLEYRPTDTLFKYCSQEAFFGIIESKRLWFSDLASTNDPREILLGLEWFNEGLRRLARDNYLGAGSLLAGWADRLDQHHKNVQMFSSSSSLEKDSLPMWGAYAADYTGVAIGFRPTALLGVPARVQLVKYLDTATPNDFRLLVNALADSVIAAPASDELSLVKASAAARAAMTALKHDSWAHEKEVRLVHSQPRRPPDEGGHPIFSATGLLPSGQLLNWHAPLGRNGPYGPISYLEFAFGRFRSQHYEPQRAIQVVVIGPKSPLSINEVASIMQKNGFTHFDVKTSLCQIR